jgi:hypothetical protein
MTHPLTKSSLNAEAIKQNNSLNCNSPAYIKNVMEESSSSSSNLETLKEKSFRDGRTKNEERLHGGSCHRFELICSTMFLKVLFCFSLHSHDFN